MAELNFIAPPAEKTEQPTKEQQLSFFGPNPEPVGPEPLVAPVQAQLDPALLQNEDMSFQERYELYLQLCAQRRQAIQATSDDWHAAIAQVEEAKARVKLAKLAMLTAKAQPAPRVPSKHDWEV